ncbi:hypothetical protein LOC67_17180 [Stieleria sp. JC731]|uniref:hypothetical protein n=1 Tax=Pirellulaceae TaxID=2691357 RepID=UPI001E4682E2|nr:hypothetical protein [Stieleria sp. JC731]MCC9602290.1 hypothetical protein [Stieleria sp. JC731]
MRFLFAMAIGAFAFATSFAEESPLDTLTVTSTRLKCLSGFAEITYGYKRGASKAAVTELAFVVIESDKYNSRFRSVFRLSSKVDDVTPPAYLGMEQHTEDLPGKNQVYAIIGGRYMQADSDVTLAEIRAWIDQPDMHATIESLLDFKARMRASRKGNEGE